MELNRNRTGGRGGHKSHLVLGGLIGIGVFGFIWSLVCGLPSIRIFSSSDASATSTQVSLGIKTVLSLTTTPESALSIPITPTSSGAHSTRKLTSDVATNNLTGFTLTMSSGEDLEDPNDTTSIPPNTIPGTSLVNLSGNSTNTLPTSSGTVTTPIVLVNNTWGYAIPKTQTNSTGLLPEQTSGFDTTYSEVTSQASLTSKFAQVPAIATPVKLKTTTTQTATDKTDMYVGTRVDTSKPAGNYRGTIVLSLLANYVEPEIIDMQKFTASDCGALAINETVILRDNRANKQLYRVRRLADGKCWMIDNLKLGDTGEELILTSSDSNVTEDFRLPPNAISVTGSTAGQPNRLNNGRCDSGSNTGIGDYLTCAGTTNGTSPVGNYNFVAYVDPSGMDACLKNVATSGDINTYNPSSLTGCGYLYNWYTATAGEGIYGTPADTNTNANAVASSICPANWRLPKAGDGGANDSNEFAVLNGAMLDNGGPSLTVDAATYPNFRPTGSFSGSYSGNWTTMNQGYIGYYWSASAYSSVSVRNLYFTYSGTFGLGPDSGGAKYYGNAVRCVL